MKIAILGSVALPVPPPAQGGTEWIAYYQAKGLSERGHKVILFAAKGSKKDNYELVEVGMGDTVAGAKPIQDRTPVETILDRQYTESSRNLRKENVYLAQALQQLIDRKDDYDIILNNMRGEAVFLPVAKLLEKPFVNVMHLPIFPELAEIFKTYKTHIITISQAQRKEYQDLNYLATVNNCVDTEKYVMLNHVILNSFQDPNKTLKQVQGDKKEDDYLLMMGSIAPHKNQAGAIRVAKKLGMKLVLAGKIGNQDYFDSIKADIDGTQIKWIGELAFSDKLKLYQKAKAFLFPILWEEPFGLVMIEALSCGTPVVAFGNGAIPEVVVDGKIGFVIENSRQPSFAELSSATAGRQITNNKQQLTIKTSGEEGLVEAVKTITYMNEREYQMLRQNCRRHVEENFTIDLMVNDYEVALQRLIDNS
ncbi:hypothetical protein A3D03_06400 [Candidatus Gottesmanbacteria bacterium RIFCSPHIGHO2_02_FULL_40_13]|uniref:Glycosyl transferase family 1 domain-containing protein n=1 Tax=Candidatus Gottesmanbacteria bacterium RIFCSPHIGHO2_02_FULL_40_13 TaxID=1798384 RepID=A0A1F6AAX7_9BACT|nr:MAG: hypothetical protein A3D03_06400 [Candidatus Gottesmanbacteria bacterium RIFCSPHIGHO2_02_FULL_40_13]